MWAAHKTIDPPLLKDIVEEGINPFDFNYQLFHVEQYTDFDRKKEFETLFLDVYYFRQLCMAPTEKWLRRFRAEFKRLLPTYNQMYELAAMDYNPLYTDYHETIGSDDRNRTNKREYGSATKGGTSTTDRTSEASTRGANVDFSSTQDGTENIDDTTHTVSKQNTVKDTTTDQNRSLDVDQTTDGTSDRDYNETRREDGTWSEQFADTPQARLESPPNGRWLTNATDRQDTRTTQINGSENVSTHEKMDRGEKETTDTTQNENTTVDFTEDVAYNRDRKTGQQLKSSQGEAETTKDFGTRNSDSASKSTTAIDEKYNEKERTKNRVTEKGRRGTSPADLKLAAVRAILNVDQQFIDALAGCFLSV